MSCSFIPSPRTTVPWSITEINILLLTFADGCRIVEQMAEKTITVGVPEKAHAKLRRIVKRTGRSLRNEIVEAIADRETKVMKEATK